MFFMYFIQHCFIYTQQISLNTEPTRNKFHCWLSICGMVFIADWAYAEMFKSWISRPNQIWFSKISCYRPLGPCFYICGNHCPIWAVEGGQMTTPPRARTVLYPELTRRHLSGLAVTGYTGSAPINIGQSPDIFTSYQGGNPTTKICTWAPYLSSFLFCLVMDSVTISVRFSRLLKGT